MSLIRIADYSINPHHVISVAPLGGDNPNDEFFINVNMGDYVSSYKYQNDYDGWNIESVTEAINAACLGAV